MAAIDFPASPTNLQLFVAANGVTYQYSTAYTAWQVVSVAASPPGADAGCKTTFMPSDVAILGTGFGSALCDTGLIGAAGQKWRISGYMTALCNAGQSFLTAYLVNSSSLQAVGSSAVNPLANQTVNIAIECIYTLLAPTTFTLYGNGSPGSIAIAATAAAGNTACAITAERLT